MDAWTGTRKVYRLRLRNNTDRTRRNFVLAGPHSSKAESSHAVGCTLVHKCAAGGLNTDHYVLDRLVIHRPDLTRDFIHRAWSHHIVALGQCCSSKGN